MKGQNRKLLSTARKTKTEKSYSKTFDRTCPSCSRDHLGLYGQGEDHDVTLTLETRFKVKTRLYAIIGVPDDPIITDADENLGISFFCFPLPWVPEVFSRVRRDTSSAEGRRDEWRSREKKTLAQSALICRARWTLTLSLICQSNRRSQTRSSKRSHIILRKTNWSLKIIV